MLVSNIQIYLEHSVYKEFVNVCLSKNNILSFDLFKLL